MKRGDKKLASGRSEHVCDLIIRNPVYTDAIEANSLQMFVLECFARNSNLHLASNNFMHVRDINVPAIMLNDVM